MSRGLGDVYKRQSMKRCFKSISGASLGTFMKRKRMEAAAELLRSEPTLSVGEIASLAGYENQGKFSGAFKSVYEMTPIAYRLNTRDLNGLRLDLNSYRRIYDLVLS